MLGRYTAQRGGDILKWTRKIYDGEKFTFRQSKTARRKRSDMAVHAPEPLKAYLTEGG